MTFVPRQIQSGTPIIGNNDTTDKYFGTNIQVMMDMDKAMEALFTRHNVI